MTEQRYKAVEGVLADGRTVSDVAGQWEVSRRTGLAGTIGGIDEVIIPYPGLQIDLIDVLGLNPPF